jgi:hypothetical protein
MKDGEWDHFESVLPFLRDHMQATRATCQRYGEYSRASYLAKFVLLTKAFETACGLDQYCTTRKLSDCAAELCTRLRSDMSEHYRLNDKRRSSIQVDVECAGLPENPIYVLTNTDMRAEVSSHLPRINGLVCEMSSKRSWRSGIYLYCVSADGRILALNASLQHIELLCGITVAGTRITHAHIASMCDYSVRCAGECFTVCDSGGRIRAAILTRGSGHFRPSTAAIKTAGAVARERLDLEEDRIILVG